jgi:acyl carrier protein
MSEDILARVVKVTCSQLNKPEGEIKAESSFMEDLGADSLDVVELVMAFEDEFGIEIPDTDVTELKTVNDAVEYIRGKQAA